MGLTTVQARVANPVDPDRRISVEFLVDSGAVYSLVPRAILEALGIRPHSRREFVLANGEVVVREMGTAVFEYRDQRGDSLVIFGEEGDSPALGTTTVEGFGLILGPVRRELKPIPMWL